MKKTVLKIMENLSNIIESRIFYSKFFHLINLVPTGQKPVSNF